LSVFLSILMQFSILKVFSLVLQAPLRSYSVRFASLKVAATSPLIFSLASRILEKLRAALLKFPGPRIAESLKTVAAVLSGSDAMRVNGHGAQEMAHQTRSLIQRYPSLVVTALARGRMLPSPVTK